MYREATPKPSTTPPKGEREVSLRDSLLAGLPPPWEGWGGAYRSNLYPAVNTKAWL